MDLEYQAYRPVVLFLNGQYWGILNLREKVNEHFLASNNGVDPDNIDLMENTATLDGSPQRIIIAGDDQHYNSMIDFITNNDMTTATNYEDIKTLMEIDNFINYQITQIYINNRDWPGSNCKYWRPRTGNGKWRWIIYDTDFGFGLSEGRSSREGVNSNSLKYALSHFSSGGHNPLWATLLFRKLMENNQFKIDFINRFADLLNTIFQTENVIARIDEIESTLEKEMPNHITRWGGISMDEWHDNVEKLRTFARKRIDIVREHIINQFNLPGTSILSLESSPAEGGKIKVNRVEIEEFPWEGQYFQTIPVELTAIPKAGYRFVNWKGITPADSVSVTINVPENVKVMAQFVTDSFISNRIIINEINYNSSNDFDPGDWVELYNKSSSPLDISGWLFKDSDDSHIFSLPLGTLLEPNAYLVLCQDSTTFSASFPPIDNYVGNFGFGLSGEGELIRLFDEQGNREDSLSYGKDSPWPTEPNGNGPTLALRDPHSDNALPENWMAADHFGTPGMGNHISSTIDETGLSFLPPEFTLGPNYPNPFNSTTIIPYALAKSHTVTLQIYTLLGQKIRTLVQGAREVGSYSVRWDGQDDDGRELASGVYLYRLWAGQQQVETRKLLLLR